MNIDGNALTSLERLDKPNSRIEVDERNGTISGTVTYTCLWRLVLVLMPKEGVSKHPDFPNLIASKVSAVKNKDAATVTATYIGNPESGNNGGGEDGEFIPVYSGNSSASQEPIQAHEKFRTTIGLPENGAIFDKDGAFTKFTEPDGDGEDFEGLEAYLLANDTHTQTRLSRNPPSSVSGVGAIDSPVGAPDLRNSNMTWLKVRRTYDKIGGFYEISETWMASGPKGWNTTVYPGGVIS